MKNKIYGIVVCMLCIVVVFPAFSIPASAEPNAKFITAVYGSFPYPAFIHSVSGTILNIEDVTAYNVSYSLTIKGGFNNDINTTVNFTSNELLPGKALGIKIIDSYGIGPVKITITVSASNANTTIRIAKGFQIGGFTWIPLTWITPSILQNFIPWLNVQPT